MFSICILLDLLRPAKLCNLKLHVSHSCASPVLWISRRCALICFLKLYLLAVCRYKYNIGLLVMMSVYSMGPLKNIDVLYTLVFSLLYQSILFSRSIVGEGASFAIVFSIDTL